MRLINLHCVHHYQWLFIVLILTIISIGLINCNQTESTLLSSSSSPSSIPCFNQSDTINTTTNTKTINLTANHESSVGIVNNLTPKSVSSYNRSELIVDKNSSSLIKEIDSIDNNNQSKPIKAEKVIIRLKRARSKNRPAFGSEDRAKAQGAGKSSARPIHQQLDLTINSLSFGLIIQLLFIINQQLNLYHL